MSRAANYTIKGFLYQFNKTLIEVLKAQDSDIITVEGVLEDVEIKSPKLTTGIQCKYHEASAGFSPSSIYKPLLQMLAHFSVNPDEKFEYVLFAHFPGAEEAPPLVGKPQCEEALASKNKDLKTLIEAIPEPVDFGGFLARFKMEFGPSYDNLVAQVSNELKDAGIPEGEIEVLAYPNAIHKIAELSILADPEDRQITRRQFLDHLASIRTTAISRWTMALHTRKKLLDERRKQLKVHLDQNSRLRYFIIEPKSFNEFDNEIVLFITDFIAKYHFKPAHIRTPLLYIRSSREVVQEIQSRLYAKSIVTADGYVGSEFEETYFFRDSFSAKGARGIVYREFSLRIASQEQSEGVLSGRKCDDLYILGESDCDAIDMRDVNVERLLGTTIKEIKYTMGVSNVYE